MREAKPYPVEAPITNTLRGSRSTAGGAFSATAIWAATFCAQPSGCALTQMKPRERRLMTCRGINFNARNARKFERDTLQRPARKVHKLAPVRLRLLSL